MVLYSDTDRLSLALAAADLGDWSWDVHTDLVTCSARAAAIFQIPPGPHLTWTAMRELLHRDDAEGARLAVEHAVATGADYRTEYRLVNGTGTRWVAASGRGVYDDHGVVSGMLGVVQDISEQVSARDLLRAQTDAARASEERYRAFIEHSSAGIWRLEFEPPIDTSLPVDAQVRLALAHGRVAECNLAMARMCGLARCEDLVGQPLEFMLRSAQSDANAYLAVVVGAGYRVTDVDSAQRDATGELKHFSNSMTGIIEDGCLKRIWGTQRSIDDRKHAERVQAHLAAIVDSADDAIVAKDLNGIIQSWNAGAQRVFGYAPSEIIGKPVRVLIPADRQSEEDDILSRVRRGERVAHFETVRVCKDGHQIHVSLTVSPVRDGSGAIVGASKIVRDITAHKEATAALAAQQVWFRVTLSSIGDAVIACDASGVVTFVNATAVTLTGWSNDEALGRPLTDVFSIVNETTREPVVNPVMKVMARGETVGLANHTILIARDGREHPIADSAAPIRDADGRMLGVVLVFRDVSEQRDAERAVQQHRAWLQSTLESITDAFCALDHEWRFTYVNRQAEALLGRTRESLLGRSHWEAYPDMVGSDVERTYRRAVAERTSLTLEFHYEPHRRWYEAHVYPSETGLSVYFRDVSHRKERDLALRDSEQRFRQLADAMPQIVWTAAANGSIDYLNRRWTEFTGLPDTVGNEGWAALLHPEDAPAARALWAASTRSGEAFEMPIRLRDRRDQSYRWHLVRTVAVRDGDGHVSRWFGTATDIHQQKSAEASLRYLAEVSAELGTVVDYETTLQKVATSAVPFFADWSAVDLVEAGGLRRLAVAHQDPDKVQLANDLMRAYPPDPDAPVGMYAVLRTGQPVIVSGITDEMLVQGAKDAPHLALLRALGLRSYICVPLVASGTTIGLLTFATAESGRLYSREDLSLAMDLAQRASIAVENTRLYEALRLADRRKNEFLATLAHELRNPLAPIRNALEIIRLPRVAPETLERARAMMERQVHHVVRLVDDLLDVSRVMGGKIELRRERIELAAAVARAVETVQPLIDAQHHELSVALPADSLLLEADAVRLAQVLGNLLTNAAKYTDPGGRVAVTAERVGNSVLVRVRDNGIGIDPSMHSRVFDLFVQADHSTDRSQGGLGIGLTLAKNLVEMHSGTIEARSEGLGTGTEMVITLPLVVDARHEETPVTASPRERRSDEQPARVLVVDDNDDAAESLAMLLRAEGHEVHVAFTGPAALEIVTQHRPDIAFLDIGMPGMDGYEVARRIRSQPAAQKVVLVALTGWGQEEDRRRSGESGFDHHVVKPLEPQAALALVASRRTKER